MAITRRLFLRMGQNPFLYELRESVGIGLLAFPAKEVKRVSLYCHYVPVVATHLLP
jgi:hypothetical protein